VLCAMRLPIESRNKVARRAASRLGQVVVRVKPYVGSDPPAPPGPRSARTPQGARYRGPRQAASIQSRMETDAWRPVGGGRVDEKCGASGRDPGPKPPGVQRSGGTEFRSVTVPAEWQGLLEGGPAGAVLNARLSR